jgi:hypothetical protein
MNTASEYMLLLKVHSPDVNLWEHVLSRLLQNLAGKIISKNEVEYVKDLLLIGKKSYIFVKEKTIGSPSAVGRQRCYKRQTDICVPVNNFFLFFF